MTIPKAGALAKASDWSAAFPLDTDAWTAYTPTLTQSATVAKTVSYGKYTRVGRFIVAQASMSVTGAGTAANAVLFGLPVAATGTGQLAVGSADMFDSSAGIFYAGTAVLDSTTTAKFVISGFGNYAGVAGFTAALASADFVSFSVMYESVS